jgi:pimeloyl-ACP methyl ester carboxylesterase
MNRILAFICASFLLTAAPHVEAASELKNVPLVFIHGIKGSKLVGKDRKTVWVTLQEALSLSTPNIALPMSFQDGIQTRDDISAVGPLTKLVAIPKLLEVDVYASWLTRARKLGRPFRVFTYDWRRDNNETTDLFFKFLLEVQQKNNGAKIQVVAHSMGGLITLALLKEHPEIFHSVVFAGVPFGGGIGFLPDLHAGTATGINKKILAPNVLATFPSVYSLFPLENRQLLSKDQKIIPGFDFYNADDWKKQRLGIFRRGIAPLAAENFLREALGKARQFRNRIYQQITNQPPVLVVASRKYETLIQAVKDGPKAERGWDFETAAKSLGDGRVSYESTMPPLGLSYRVFETDNRHDQLLADPKVVENIANGSWLR